MFSNIYLYSFIQTIILKDEARQDGQRWLTMTLAPGFLGTQWLPFTEGSVDIAESIDMGVASRIVPYSHLAAFWLTSSSLSPTPQGVKWNPSGNYHSWLDGYYELSSGTVVFGNTIAAFHRGIHGHHQVNCRECCVPLSSVFSSYCFSAHLLLVICLLRV